ncbi:MAG: MBL fold metallo-hydrolase [Verrucomicrobiota bacterium]|nr:MBL fold metallo-hydrolase [Verrucomicrobiota bacterium]
MKRPFLAIVAALLVVVSAQAEKTLDVYWVDVEGGAATLIVTPAGQSILIDTGNPGTRDAGRIHEVATKLAKLKKIDFLITTHFHGDHYGGAATLAQLMPIGVVNDNGIPVRNPDRNRQDPAFVLKVRPYRSMKVDGRVVVKPGYKLPLKQAKGAAPVSLTIVAADRKFIDPPKGAQKNPLAGTVPPIKEDLSDNANSVCSLITVGNFRFLDCGDLTWNMEAKLVEPINRIGTVDVYQVNHHGLASSNNPLLIKSVAPTVSVMNNSHTKGCTPAAFAALKSAKSIKAMYQVHRNLRKDGDKNNAPNDYIANLTPRDDCKAHTLKMSVATDGRSYTLSNPRSGHKRTFKTRKH